MRVLWCRRCKHGHSNPIMVIQTLSWSLEPCCGHHLYDCIAATLIFAALRVVPCGQHLRWVGLLQGLCV